ncbi:MAG TPA: transketolase [Armatimonadota bacterium]|jgi:transketolase
MSVQTSGLSVDALQEKAKVIRRHVVEMICAAKSGHPGGSLSAADLVTALYFGGILRHDPTNPADPNRDRFILSKGHAVPVLYAALAEAGYLPIDQLTTLRQLGSPLQGHPSKADLPIMEASTGSLGQGLSVGMGMALAGKLNQADYKVYVMLGDGEAEEGQVWEAAMGAAAHHLDNLVAILDYNKFQLDGSIEDILDWGPVVEKWQAFGWQVIEVDGHDMAAILKAFAEAQTVTGKPVCIVAHTVKGQGISFIAGNNDWHGKAPSNDELCKALAELA